MLRDRGAPAVMNSRKPMGLTPQNLKNRPRDPGLTELLRPDMTCPVCRRYSPDGRRRCSCEPAPDPEPDPRRTVDADPLGKL